MKQPAFIARLATALRYVFGRYEAAYQRWNDRSWIPAATQDARFDADASTRLELVRRSRYWERNNAIVNRLADLFEQFTVGPNGLAAVPSSSDAEWNLAASEAWEGWSRYPDLVSLQPLGILQGLMARSWFVDGEIFIHKTSSPESNRPRIRLIEGHRIATPYDMAGDEGDKIIDGVCVNKFGRPEAYMMRVGPTGSIPYAPTPKVTEEKWLRIPATEVVHLFEPCRPGQMRGLPFLYAVMNDLHDLDDLQLMECKAAKAAAEITNVVKNASGEADPEMMRRQRFSIQTQNTAGQTVTKDRDLYFHTTLGGRTVVLRTGEDIAQFQSNRPSVAAREFWDYLTAKVCAGVGISKLLVLPTSMQGTVTRADLDVANAFFRSRSAVIAAAIREVYVWVMGYEVRYNRALDGAPADWSRVVIRPPRAVNVDIGRNSAAMLAELESGTRTYQDIYAESGADWRDALRQRAEEAAYVKKLAEEYDVEPDLIAQPVKQMTQEEKEEPAETLKKEMAE